MSSNSLGIIHKHPIRTATITIKKIDESAATRFSKCSECDRKSTYFLFTIFLNVIAISTFVWWSTN